MDSKEQPPIDEWLLRYKLSGDVFETREIHYFSITLALNKQDIWDFLQSALCEYFQDQTLKLLKHYGRINDFGNEIIAIDYNDSTMSSKKQWLIDVGFENSVLNFFEKRLNQWLREKFDNPELICSIQDFCYMYDPRVSNDSSNLHYLKASIYVKSKLLW